MEAGLTFDTGALIALERRDARMARVWRVAHDGRIRITVPTVVLAEWWRGQSRLGAVLESVDVEPLDKDLAKTAGEVLGHVRASAIDAIVMASAARRGDLVYTSDFEDLQRLRDAFPAVRVLRV